LTLIITEFLSQTYFCDIVYEDIAIVMKFRINIPNRLKVIMEKYNLS